ncbi:MAG: PAS domain S-box protein [Methanomicrobiales archaeon]|nr:PAS domain S-box protein [Methanomicrobiales archaeon]
MYHCFDELDDAVIILDQDNYVAGLNRSSREIFSISDEEAHGMKVEDLFFQRIAPLIPDGDSAGRVLEALRCRQEASHLTCRMHISSGEMRWFSFSCRVMTGEPCTGMVLARFRDVTPEHDEAVEKTLDAAARVRSESVYAGIGELLPYGIWISDADGTALYVSPSLLSLAGRTLEECRRSGWLDCIPLENAGEVLDDWKQCLETTCRWDHELVVADPERGYRTILSRGAPIRDECGQIVLWAGINLDVTARKHAENLTTIRAAQQGAVADLGQLALAGAELPELMDAAVRAVAEHLGIEYAKVLRYLPDRNAFLLEAVVGFDKNLVGIGSVEGGTDSQAGYTLLSHEPVVVEDLRTEERFCGPTLLRYEGIVSGISVIIRGDEAPYGVFGAHTRTLRRFTRDDINFVRAVANVLAQGIKRKTAEEALMASEEKFRAIAQRSFDMIYTCYHDRGIAYMSPAVTRILGHTPTELIGSQFRDFVSPSSLAAWKTGEERIARGESVEGFEVRLRRKDGSMVFVELNGSPIMEHEKVIGAQVIGRDITERKLSEQMRQQAFKQIERNIEQFAVLGDHIRQPLQVTLGRADLLDDEETAAIIREQVCRINDYIRQLDRGWVESREVRAFLRRHDRG